MGDDTVSLLQEISMFVDFRLFVLICSIFFVTQRTSRALYILMVNMDFCLLFFVIILILVHIRIMHSECLRMRAKPGRIIY